jgi:hypothetical protein
MTNNKLAVTCNELVIMYKLIFVMEHFRLIVDLNLKKRIEIKF